MSECDVLSSFILFFQSSQRQDIKSRHHFTSFTAPTPFLEYRERKFFTKPMEKVEILYADGLTHGKQFSTQSVISFIFRGSRKLNE